MGSTSEKKKYPRRLYREDQSPLQRRSMHNNCVLQSFGMMKDYVGDEMYEDIRDKSQVGVILKLANSSDVWCAKTVHHFLTHQLAIERRYEMWSLIERNSIRFSLHEFEDLTGLNCDPFDLEDKVEVDHREFWGDMKVDAGQGPNWEELYGALKSCRTWSPEKRKMLGLLFVLHLGILGLARGSRIPLEYAKRVLDGDAFERFPWGRVGFKSLIQSIKVMSFESNTYTIHGCAHVLLIWTYGSVVELGEAYGNKKLGDDVPLLSWNGGRPRKSIGDFLFTEKKRNKKLRVHQLVVRPEEKIYLVWEDENIRYGEGEGGYKLLDNLLHDIMYGHVDESAWDDSDVVDKKGKRKILLTLFEGRR